VSRQRTVARLPPPTPRTATYSAYRHLLRVGDVVGSPASVEEVYVPARRSCWNRVSRFDAQSIATGALCVAWVDVAVLTQITELHHQAMDIDITTAQIRVCYDKHPLHEQRTPMGREYRSLIVRRWLGDLFVCSSGRASLCPGGVDVGTGASAGVSTWCAIMPR
jgi:hypothetical protein